MQQMHIIQYNIPLIEINGAVVLEVSFSKILSPKIAPEAGSLVYSPAWQLFLMGILYPVG